MVIIGMFGQVEGGGFDSRGAWFPWHPVYMALSYPCCMGLGRLAYVARMRASINVRRALHACFMGCGVVAAALGYYAIFAAHWPGGKFFGYNFQQHEWKSGDGSLARILHSWLGYAVLGASFVQGCSGPLKIKAIAAGQRAHTWHGKLGKYIILGAMANLLLAVYFWPWSLRMKFLLCCLFTAAGLLAAMLPRHSGQPFSALPMVTSAAADDAQSNELAQLAVS